MTPLIVLAALVLVPTLAILWLRVNGAIAFMSLALGSVLVTYTSSDVDGVLTSMSSGSTRLTVNQWSQLGLLVVPLLLTILFTRGSVKKSAKKLGNVLPALAAGLLTALLVVPLLPTDLQRQIHSQTAWTQLNNLQTAVILGGATFSLVFLLFTHRSKPAPEEGKKKPSKH
jgi:membrane protease YdiL (CAAX protease family)